MTTQTMWCGQDAVCWSLGVLWAVLAMFGVAWQFGWIRRQEPTGVTKPAVVASHSDVPASDMELPVRSWSASGYARDSSGSDMREIPF